MLKGDVILRAAFGRHVLRIRHGHCEDTLEASVAHPVPAGQLGRFRGQDVGHTSQALVSSTLLALGLLRGSHEGTHSFSGAGGVDLKKEEKRDEDLRWECAADTVLLAATDGAVGADLGYALEDPGLVWVVVLLLFSDGLSVEARSAEIRWASRVEWRLFAVLAE